MTKHEKDEFKELDLKIMKPDTEHVNYGIMFDAAGEHEELVAAYNYAIETILKKDGLNPFLETREVGDTEYLWEAWQDVDTKDLKIVMTEIHALAKERWEIEEKHNV